MQRNRSGEAGVQNEGAQELAGNRSAADQASTHSLGAQSHPATLQRCSEEFWLRFTIPTKPVAHGVTGCPCAVTKDQLASRKLHNRLVHETREGSNTVVCANPPATL